MEGSGDAKPHLHQLWPEKTEKQQPLRGDSLAHQLRLTLRSDPPTRECRQPWKIVSKKIVPNDKRVPKTQGHRSLGRGLDAWLGQHQLYHHERRRTHLRGHRHQVWGLRHREPPDDRLREGLLRHHKTSSTTGDNLKTVASNLWTRG